MRCGQPQGCRLSAVLCDLYYSDLDRTHLRDFQNDGDLLIRGVDDYLFVTTNLDRAARYVVKQMPFPFPRAEAIFPTDTITQHLILFHRSSASPVIAFE